PRSRWSPAFSRCPGGNFSLRTSARLSFGLLCFSPWATCGGSFSAGVGDRAGIGSDQLREDPLFLAEEGIPSFGQLSDQRADDVAVVVGPHPLAWVSALGGPMPRLCEGSEILLATCNRGNRGAKLVRIGLFVGIRLVAQKRHEPVRCGDACDH